MKRYDIQGLHELTAENHWNMEKAYLECVFNTDPTGLVVVVTEDGKVIGKKRTNPNETKMHHGKTYCQIYQVNFVILQ